MTEPSRPHRPDDPWGPHPLPPGDEVRVVRVGPLTLRVRHQTDEVWLAHRSGGWDEPDEPEADEEPGSSEADDWTRWPVPADTGQVILTPGFPDRPVVVEPELSFRLIRGARARIYIRVPLWVKVQLPGKEPVTLREIPTVVLSDTWWGGFTEGELCYWLETQARRKVGPEDFESHLAICPLQLVNRSDGDLNVEKLALRVAHLSIFRGGGSYWADETRVRYQGEDEGSEIDMTGKAPEEAPEAVRVSGPRTPLDRGLRARTFARLKALPGFGGSV